MATLSSGSPTCCLVPAASLHIRFAGMSLHRSGSAMGADVKGDAYEGLLERNAQDVNSGAGQ